MASPIDALCFVPTAIQNEPEQIDDAIAAAVTGDTSPRTRTTSRSSRSRCPSTPAARRSACSRPVRPGRLGPQQQVVGELAVGHIVHVGAPALMGVDQMPDIAHDKTADPEGAQQLGFVALAIGAWDKARSGASSAGSGLRERQEIP